MHKIRKNSEKNTYIWEKQYHHMNTHLRTLLFLALALLVPSRASAQMEAVDLGLSVKWASCNLGASKPKDAGHFYAWGETKPKTVFSEKNYGLYKEGPQRSTGNLAALEYLLTKYCSDKKTSDAPGVYGNVDGKTVLEAADDPARKERGGNWRIPTREEMKELHEKCDWKWTEVGGVPGYKVSSRRNGNSIFLPAAGYYRDQYHYRVGLMGYYWAANLADDYPTRAHYLGFSEKDILSESWWLRFYGFNIRPVTP